MRRFFPLALLLLFGFPATLHADRLDTALEKLLGKPIAWALVETSGEDTDPLLRNWVQAVGAKVSAQAPRQDVRYSFAILGTDVANAYAAPGGYIFVTRGLLDTIESDDELASVLAHESGHVAKRHAVQLIGSNLLVLALVGQVKDKDWKNVLQIANVFRTLQKSRELEAQADEIGITYAYAAGYDPAGMVHFFERLTNGRGKTGRLEAYFVTHPSPEKRLERARQDVLVRRPDPDERERVAAGYAARGLSGAAETALRGGDPLRPLPARPVPLPGTLAEERRAISDRIEGARRGLDSSYKAQRAGGWLQQILPINSRPGDYRWVYLAFRAYAVQTRVEDVYARTLRVLRGTPQTFDGLAGYAALPPGDPTRADAAAGRWEVARASERVAGAVRPLARASQTALAVLADLNNPFYRPKAQEAWIHYGALEGLLRYAESELARADRASGQAWRLLSLARIRRYQARLDELAPPGDPARRALWADLATRRLGKTPPADGAAGAATVRTALAVELSAELGSIDAGRGDRFWADWVLQKNGIPENIATAMRLLTLDLERETAAQDRRRAQNE